MISPHPLRDQIRDQIRHELIHGRLAPGQQLVLAPLARRLSVSPTPTREALAQLEEEGLIQLHPNRGFFVAAMTLDEALEIYPLLAGLETLALELQGLLPVDRIRHLEQVNAEMEAEIGNAAALFQRDLEWHQALVEGCPNSLVLRHLRSVRNRAERYERAYMRYSGKVAFSTADHRRIAEALAEDVSAACSLLQAHWERSRRFVQRWLSRVGDESSTP